MSEQGIAPAGDAPISAREAAVLISTPEPVKETPVTEAEAPSPAAEPVAESASQEDDTGPAEKPVPGETEEADPAPEAPSIEPPRSWSKDHKDAFKALPRHLQEAVSESERAREADFHTRTREAAERAKAVEVREQAAEQVRQQYEQALPALLAQTSLEFRMEFGNPTWEDIDDWSRNDQPKWVKFQQWDRRFQAQQAELQQTQARQQQEMSESWVNYRTEQTKLLHEKAPELADIKTAPTRHAEARSFMNEQGFSNDELAGYVDQYQPMSIHDHRVQMIIRNAMLYEQAQKAARKTTPKPVPPVQRPGTAPVKGEARQSQLKDLDTKLDRSGDVRDAARLLGALRRRAS